MLRAVICTSAAPATNATIPTIHAVHTNDVNPVNPMTQGDSTNSRPMSAMSDSKANLSGTARDNSAKPALAPSPQ